MTEAPLFREPPADAEKVLAAPDGGIAGWISQPEETRDRELEVWAERVRDRLLELGFTAEVALESIDGLALAENTDQLVLVNEHIAVKPWGVEFHDGWGGVRRKWFVDRRFGAFSDRTEEPPDWWYDAMERCIDRYFEDQGREFYILNESPEDIRARNERNNYGR